MSENKKDLTLNILEILREDGKKTAEEIAGLTGAAVGQVQKTIKALEENGTILKYRAVIRWDKVVEVKQVTALIEVRVAPKRGYGFEKIAERIYQFDEVRSLYLVSGGYDLLALVEGRNLQEVAAFVSDKLSTLDDVQGTTTHFMLKRFKEDGDILQPVAKGSRLEVSP